MESQNFFRRICMDSHLFVCLININSLFFGNDIVMGTKGTQKVYVFLDDLDNFK